MATITYYVALPILAGEDSDLFAGEVAFSRSGDPSTGEFEPAVVIASFGNLPSDIADMMGGQS
jgi:hypothetical protein